jgi:hypothetical protein
MDYPLIEHEGHLLIDVDGRRCLIDTGSPWSLGALPLTLAGREFAAQKHDLIGTTAASLAEMVGTHLDGLIGTDVLGEFDVEISSRDSRFTVSEAIMRMEEGVHAETVQGVPLIWCETMGKPVRMFFDTGAPLSYVSEEYLQGSPSLGTLEDFHPLMGRFTVTTHALEVCAWGRPMRIRAGRMPPLLEAALGLADVQGILGTEVLRHGVLRWSSRQQRIALLPHVEQE